MLFINEDHYTRAEVAQAFKRYEQIRFLQDAEQWRVAVCLTDAFEWLTLFLYIREKGGSVVPIHAASPKEAALRTAKASKSNVLFYGTLEKPIVLHEEKQQEGTLVQLTSGTTGEPKCILRTWASIEEELDSYNQALAMNADIPPVVACPITHSYGLLCGVMASIKRGAEPIIVTHSNPKYVLKLLRKYPVHLFYAAPALLYGLIQLSEEAKPFDLVMTSGTLLPGIWLERLLQKSGRVLQQYGCSEAGCISVHPAVQNPDEMGTPLSHISIKAGTEEKPDEIIVYKKDQIIHTKDVGYITAKGNLHFLARLDDTINVAGLNVYPHEVENVLLEIPGVEEAVVYKRTDSFSGERVCAKYVSAAGVDEQDIRNWCRSRLAPHQIPIEIIAASSIPALSNGKINRKQLSIL